MNLNFSNPSIFTQESADIKLAYVWLAVSQAKDDGFKKFKIMVVHLDIMMEDDGKRYQFLLVSYDFEKLAS